MGYFFEGLLSFGDHPVSVYERKYDVRLNLFSCVSMWFTSHYLTALQREKKK